MTTTKSELTENTRVPLRSVWAVIGLVVFGTAGWMNLKSEIHDGFSSVNNRLDGVVTEKQFQAWRDDALEQNARNQVVFPRLPQKQQGMGKVEIEDLAKH